MATYLIWNYVCNNLTVEQSSATFTNILRPPFSKNYVGQKGSFSKNLIETKKKSLCKDVWVIQHNAWLTAAWNLWLKIRQVWHEVAILNI